MADKDKLLMQNEALKKVVEEQAKKLEIASSSITMLEDAVAELRKNISESKVNFDIKLENIKLYGKPLSDPNDVDTVQKQVIYNKNQATIGALRTMRNITTSDGITFPTSQDITIREIRNIEFTPISNKIVEKAKNNEFADIEIDKKNNSAIKVINLYGEKIGEITLSTDVVFLKKHILAKTNMVVKIVKTNRDLYIRVSIY